MTATTNYPREASDSSPRPRPRGQDKNRRASGLLLAGTRVRDVEAVPVARPTRELVERRETRAVGGATVKVG
jgi:hypothetical protein